MAGQTTPMLASAISPLRTGRYFNFDTGILITPGENQNVFFFLGDPNLNVYSSPQVQRVEHDVPSKRRGKQYQR